MLNRRTYPHLVRDFCVRVEVYDELYASMEQDMMVRNDKSLKGKNRKEMGLKEFEEMKVRSAMIGVDVTIT